MTDLHTHILPGIDDGAADLAQSLAMLRLQQSQGVDTVVLTPHFYRTEETTDSFLSRRQQSYETLLAALPADAPKLILGAEVAWYRGLSEEPRLSELCLGDSGCILLELPLSSWSQILLDQIYQFYCITGITPIIAHVERYTHLLKQGQVDTLIDMGIPLQLSAEPLLMPLERRKALRMLKRGAWFLGSDCHDTDTRPPNLAPAAAYIQKHLPAADGILNWQP